MSTLRTVEDQMGREVTFFYPPRDIVSLVPSQTEFLIDLGAPIVGRTKFCIHPMNRVKNIVVIGGTKKFRFDVIRKLKPHLIIGNKEENYQEGIVKLEKEFPVWMSNISALDDCFDMMSAIGTLTGRECRATFILNECIKSLQRIKNRYSGKIIYLIWKNPWMAAGKNTFIDDMVTHLGFVNLITDERYPELTTDQITKLDPDQILLSSEPFPFWEKDLEEAKKLWSNTSIRLVNGELHSWYGSRLKQWDTELPQSIN